MSLYNSFDRSKHFEELATPLDTAMGVLSPAVRKTRALQNLGGMATLQVGDATTEVATITTSATTAMAFHRRTSAISGIIGLTLTAFAFTGTMADNTAAAFGASLISFPTETFVAGRYLSGTLTATGADDRTTLCEMGMGTTIGSGANATLSAVGAAAESIMGGTPGSAFTDGGTTSVATVFGPRETSINASIAPGILLRTTTPGLAVFLNGAGAAQDIVSNATLSFSFTGTVALEYVFFG